MELRTRTPVFTNVIFYLHFLCIYITGIQYVHVTGGSTPQVPDQYQTVQAGDRVEIQCAVTGR